MTRNYSCSCTLVLLFALLLPHFLKAQWTVSPTAGSVAVHKIYAGDNAWIALAAGGVYRSEDDGDHWALSRLFSEYSTILQRSGSDWYVADGNNGLFYSNDEAVHWTALSQDVPPSISAPDNIQVTDHYIFLDNFNSLYRYDKTQPANAEKIMNYTPLYYPTTLSMQASGNKVWVAVKDSVLYSTDEGNTWTLMSEGLRIQQLAQNGDTLLAAVGAGVYRSIDNGATWNPVLFDSYPYGLFWEGGQWFVSVYTNGISQLKVSNDGGSNWSNYSTYFYGFSIEHFARKGDLLLAASNGGVLRTAAPYVYSELTSTGMPAGDNFILEPNLTKVGTYLTREDQFSGDNGDTWFQPLMLAGLGILSPVWHQGYYYGLTQSRKLIRSLSDMKHWEETGVQFPGQGISDQLLSDGDKLYHIEYETSANTISVSTDGGLTWTNTGGSVFGNGLTIHNGFLLEWRNNLGLHRSADGGVHWQSVGAGLGNLYLSFSTPGIYSNGSNLFVYSSYGIRMSTNNGLTFTNVSNKLLSTNGFEMGATAVAMEGNYLVALTYEGIFLRTMGNDQWYNISDNLPYTDFYNEDVVISNGEIFLDYGYFADPLWRRPLSSIHLAQLDGKVYHDDNNNGQQDPGEQPFADAILQGGGNYFATTHADGTYSLFAEISNDTLRVKKTAPWVQSNPEYYLLSGSATGMDFGLYFPLNVTDLRVNLTNETAFRPGFQERIYLNYFNQGTADANAQMRFILDPKLEFISATIWPDAIHGDTLIWNILEMPALSENKVRISVQINTDAPLGSIVQLFADIVPDIADVNPADNEQYFSRIVVGSYDPNDKQCNVQTITPEEIKAGNALEYTIRFQNTGTYPAEFVRIADTLDAQHLDVSKFHLLATSHPCRTTLSGNGILEFYFNPIDLAPSSWNEPASHGFVKYSVQPRLETTLGQDISNTAFIYFDFNPAIITNTTHTGVALHVGTQNVAAAKEIQVFPNPTSQYLTILLNGPSDEGLLRISNSLGQTVMAQNLETGSRTLDVSRLAPGAYFLEWRPASGALHVGRFVKQ